MNATPAADKPMPIFLLSSMPYMLDCACAHTCPKALNPCRIRLRHAVRCVCVTRPPGTTAHLPYCNERSRVAFSFLPCAPTTA